MGAWERVVMRGTKTGWFLWKLIPDWQVRMRMLKVKDAKGQERKGFESGQLGEL